MKPLREFLDAFAFLLGCGFGLGLFFGAIVLSATALIRFGKWLCRL